MMERSLHTNDRTNRSFETLERQGHGLQYYLLAFHDGYWRAVNFIANNTDIPIASSLTAEPDLDLYETHIFHKRGGDPATRSSSASTNASHALALLLQGARFRVP